MINFKNRTQILPSVIILISLVLLTATLVYIWFVPMPSVLDAQKGKGLAFRRLVDEADQARQRDKANALDVQQHVWLGDPDTVLAKVLASVTKIAGQRNLDVTAFRPEKTLTISGVTEIPVSARVDGSYPQIVRFLGDVSVPSLKLALTKVQFETSDTSSGSIAATVSMAAFCAPPNAQPSTPQHGPRKAGIPRRAPVAGTVSIRPIAGGFSHEG